MREMTRVLAAAFLTSGGAFALAQGTIDFSSTPVGGVLADALAAGPDGSLWSVNQTANTIGHVTFPDLHVATFDVPTPSSGLSGITAGPDGNMWFTETTARKIGRVTASGTISEFPIPASAAPPQRIFPGPNGALWSFNACFFSGCSRFIVTTTAGASTELPLNVPNSANFAASNCTLGSDGNVWCIGNETIPHPFSSHFTAARITPTGGYTAFAPPTGTQGSAIVAAPDGNVWYAWELPGGSTGVARVSPAGVITEYPVPTGNPHSWIFGLAVGANGNLYCADRQTSILYELVLSSATDAGTATLNSGTITIDIPEDLVAVSEQNGAAGIRAEGAPQTHCPAVAFIVRSGGSGFDGIEWEKTAAPTECTDMVANGEALRAEGDGTPLAFASCRVEPAPTSPDSALNPTLTIEPLGLDAVIGGVVTKVGWQECEVVESGALQCSSPGTSMAQGQKFSVTFTINGFESGLTRATCASSTPEITTYDNADTFLGFIGITELGRGRDLVDVNIRSAGGPR